MENEVYCIIPARDEEESITSTINGIIEHSPIAKKNIIVVNNASKDKTKQKVLNMGVLVLDCNKIGYGNACLTAINWILVKNLNPKWILFCDADGSDDPKDIQNLIKQIQTKTIDLLIGSRTLGKAEKGSLSNIQIFGNWLVCSLVKIFFNKEYTDMGPLRIIGFNQLKQLDMEDKTWGWNIEMLVKAIQNNLTIKEVPVVYRKRKFGVSKISGTLIMAMRVGFKILYTFFRLYFFKP
ncbi:glycosyltransferase family 2 protein [Leptospira sp. 96542]|nr:glycosyltransferase family 2 protein [Leptospira sp. 96542]